MSAPLRKPTPPRLLEALRRLQSLGRPAQWQEFAYLSHPRPRQGRYNAIRHLKRRAWVQDISVPYKAGDIYTGPRASLFQLTELGKRELALNP